MNIVILGVGKLKEDWQKDGVKEYLKRLSRYGSYCVEEVDDEPEPKNAGEALIRKVTETEGARILDRIKSDDLVIAMAIKGRMFDSVGLAGELAEYKRTGKRIVFVIGGSNGLSEAVLKRADRKLSFSQLTFPHGLMRVILLEQLYRAERINAGEKYHK